MVGFLFDEVNQLLLVFDAEVVSGEAPSKPFALSLQEFEVRLRLFLTWELNEDMLEICHMEAESVGASRLSLDHGEIILATDDVRVNEETPTVE